MTNEEATDILCYVAQNMISPLCFDKGTVKEAYLRLSGTEFNNLVKFVRDMITDH